MEKIVTICKLKKEKRFAIKKRFSRYELNEKPFKFLFAIKIIGIYNPWISTKSNGIFYSRYSNEHLWCSLNCLRFFIPCSPSIRELSTNAHNSIELKWKSIKSDQTSIKKHQHRNSDSIGVDWKVWVIWWTIFVSSKIP